MRFKHSLPFVAVVDYRLAEHHFPVSLRRSTPHFGIREEILNLEVHRDRIQDELVSGFLGFLGSVFEFVNQLPSVLSGPDGDGIGHGGES